MGVAATDQRLSDSVVRGDFDRHAFCQKAPPIAENPDSPDNSQRRIAPRSLVAVTSRPPVVRTRDGWRAAPGGLAPIVRTALGRRGGAWVSWDSACEPPPREIEGLGFRVLTLMLGRRDAEGFHTGYANRTLWPLFHDLVAPPVFEPAWWPNYRNANAAFARAAFLAASHAGSDPMFWVHDYHLMLVPGQLRELGITNPIAFFLHTPFPSPSVFARLPECAAVLEGLGQADVVAFQTEGDRQRFTEAWAMLGQGEPPTCIAVPASIDVAAFRNGARAPTTAATTRAVRRRLGDRLLLLGVERLDYTKGILERLRALELLLMRRPDLRRRLAYIQIATPSRETLPEYQRLRRRVEHEIGRLNSRFSAPGCDPPFQYVNHAVSDRQLLAYYLAADVAIVTPLRDGMNLIAKEFVVTQAAAEGRGALVLSEFAGAAVELTDAVLCNPYDVVATSEAIEQAIELDDQTRHKQIQAMTDVVAAHDVDRWADLQLAQTEHSWAQQSVKG